MDRNRIYAFSSRGGASPARRAFALATCAAAGIACLPHGAVAQSAGAGPPSVLSFLPAEGSLRLPDPGSATLATGAFDGDEAVLPAGVPVRAWTFEAAAGDRVSVTLRSRDFDALVMVVGPGLGAGLSDDDGAGGTDSRICVTLSEPGTFRAVASAFDAARGTFELALARVDEVSEALCPVTEEERLWGGEPVGALALGSAVTGRLDPDAVDPSELWTLDAPAGQPVTILLRSTEFDAYLDVGGPEAGGEVYADDDGGGGCDARIELVPLAGNRYQVRVSTATGGGGAYELTATPDPGPPGDAPCGAGGMVGGEDREADAARLVAAVSAIPPERVLEVGRERGSTLATTDIGFVDGTPAHVWSVEGVRAGVLRVEVLSDDFDPFLHLFAGPDRVPFQDDDGAGGLAAGISVPIAPGQEQVWIVVRAVGSDASGRYRVRALLTEGG